MSEAEGSTDALTRAHGALEAAAAFDAREDTLLATKATETALSWYLRAGLDRQWLPGHAPAITVADVARPRYCRAADVMAGEKYATIFVPPEEPETHDREAFILADPTVLEKPEP